MPETKPPNSLANSHQLVAEGEVQDLWTVFSLAVHDPELLSSNGHWLWGVSTFIHRPRSAWGFPWVLPVLSDGRVWPIDCDPESNPLAEDPQIQERRREAVDFLRRERGAGAAEGASPALASDLFSRCGRGVFRSFDVPGLEFLVRLHEFLVEDLTSGNLLALGVRQPPDDRLSVKEVRRGWFSEHVRVDFYGGTLEAAGTKDGPPWSMRFSNIEVGGHSGFRRRLGELLREDRLPEPRYRDQPSGRVREIREPGRARRRRFASRAGEEQGTTQKKPKGTKKSAVHDAVSELERRRPELFLSDEKLEPHNIENLLHWDAPPLNGHDIPRDTRRKYLAAELKAIYQRPQQRKRAKQVGTK